MQLEPQYTRKLGRIGRPETPSYYGTLPRELVKKMGWRDGQNMVVRKGRGRHLIVEAVWYEESIGK